MIYALLHVCCFTVFNLALRLGQRRGSKLLVMVAFNYGIALLATSLLFLRPQGGGPAFPAVAVGCGLTNGILYFVHLLVILAAYQIAGVGVTSALASSGAVVPAVVAWWIWDEHMTPGRLAALGLVPLAMLLLRPAATKDRPLGLKADLILLLTFAMAGVIGTIHRAAAEYLEPAQRPGYQLLLFAAAAAGSCSYMAARGLRPEARELRLGAVVGVANALSLLFMLLGLGVLPAVVYFPLTTSLGIVSVVVGAALLWSERITRRQLAGVSLALLVVVLVNLPARSGAPDPTGKHNETLGFPQPRPPRHYSYIEFQLLDLRKFPGDHD